VLLSVGAARPLVVAAGEELLPVSNRDFSTSNGLAAATGAGALDSQSLGNAGADVGVDMLAALPLLLVVLAAAVAAVAPAATTTVLAAVLS
jgi:hypothetical protein